MTGVQTCALPIYLELLHPRPDEPEPSFTVFLNACESVRITGNYRTYRSSFVEGFLTNGARGFIGTLATVDVQTASENARFILARLTNGEDIRIAEALRLLRAEAVSALLETRLLPKGARKKELVYRVLDSFMYVYYGDPLAHLRLPAAKAEQDALTPSRAYTISPEQHEKEEV